MALASKANPKNTSKIMSSSIQRMVLIIKLLVFLGICWYKSDASYNCSLLVYLRTTPSLNNAAIQTICSLVASSKGSNITILVHWRMSDLWVCRYHIEKGHVNQWQPYTIVEETDDFIDALSWMSSTCSSQNYLVIWGGHSVHLRSEHAYMLPAVSESRVLTHKKLVGSLKRAYETVLNGKKIALLALDTCTMSTLELAYEIQPYVDLFVASQTPQAKAGWDYKALVEIITKCDSDVKVLACNIIDSYKTSCGYRYPLSYYNLAALDLAQVQALKAQIDKVCFRLLELLKSITVAQKQKLKEILRTVCFWDRLVRPVDSYTDLYTFFKYLNYGLRDLEPVLDIKEIIADIQQLLGIIKKTVIAHINCLSAAYCHGISLYFPEDNPAPEYKLLSFCQYSYWPVLLEQLLIIEKEDI